MISLIRPGVPVSRIVTKSFFRTFAQTSAKRADTLGKKELQSFHIGLPVRFYVPPSFKNYPNVFTSPIVCLKLLWRRLYNFGRNTAQVGYARWSGGCKPQFLLWKNEAVDIFIKVNKAFAKRKIESVSDSLTMWTFHPLKARQAKLPAQMEFDWKLLKLNSAPKLEVFLPYAVPGQSLEKVLLVYRFDTKQELKTFNSKTDKIDKRVDESIVNHLAFVVDLNTNELRLCGSTFESGINDDVAIGQYTNSGTIMKIQGDIFRANDADLQVAIESGDEAV